MSEHHLNTEQHIRHGLPQPPELLSMLRANTHTEIEGDAPHFWRGGPRTWNKLSTPKRVRMRDGKTTQVTHEVRWFLDRVKGTTKKHAIKRLHDVFLHSSGWIRTGVRWRRVLTRDQADLIIRVIPAAETVCGGNAAGCFSWGYEADRKPVAESGVEYIDNDSAWQVITGMEACGHGTFSTQDMYDAAHQPYVGVLGTWEAAASVGYQPTKAEITHARQFIEGTIDSRLVHH